jgi:cytochrome P450
MDPPVHPRFRQPLNKHFSVPSVSRMQADIDRISDELLDAVAPRGECDVVEEIATQLPTRLFFPLLGIPEADWPTLQRLTSSAQLADDEAFQTEESAGRTQLRSQTDLFNYMRELVRDRRQHPQDDLASMVAMMQVGGALMVEHVAARSAMGVLVGGLETTRNGLAVGLLALMNDPDQAMMLRVDPTLGMSAAEEILRWVTPSRNRLRIVNEDLDFRGRQIHAGDWVVLWTLAANRDAAQFPDPHQFDIRRGPNPHLAFGGGIHVCLGRHVARLEIRTLVTKFVTRFVDARPVGDPDWIGSQGVNGLKKLDIRFTPAA